ncbi:MAG TPA: ABC transporter permease [Puia sp.]|nr:ABC transporter permease [Puia sp.]
MLKNYFKIAFRSLWRHKGFSALNIVGLAVGMAAFFLIFQYVRFEYSYDDFVAKRNRVYRLNTDLVSSSATQHSSNTAMAMAINLKREYPEVEDIVRLLGQTTFFKRGDVQFAEKATVYADSGLFNIFGFPLVEGDAVTALRAPFSVVLSLSTAKKYFGDADPIGQTILLSDSAFPAKVTGVMKDLPENSTVKADLFVSMSTATRKPVGDSLDYRWGWFNVTSYLLLKPGADPAALQAQLKPFMDRHMGDKLKAQQQDYVLSIEPLKATYWSERGGRVSGSRANVYIFSIIGLFILLIACINFVNLTTARSAERAKEVGIRKVIGAVRWELTRQFLRESVLLCLIAFVLAGALCEASVPFFNQLAGKTVSTGVLGKPDSVVVLLGVALLIGVLAGAYPALVLSGFRPIESLKGRFSTSTRGLLLRRGLVVFQFTISIGLIIGTVAVFSQLDYMRSRDLGFDKQQELVIDEHNDPHKFVLKQEVLQLPNVQGASFSGSVPGEGDWGAYSRIENSRGEMQVANMDLTYVDFGYLEQYKMRLLAGRFFDPHIATDTMQAMIINEKALGLFGYSKPEQAIGRRFDQWGKTGMIIGVIRNYNFEGLQKEIRPLSICIKLEDCNYLSVKVGMRDLPATISAIRKQWEGLAPNKEFDYFFLDEQFDKQYRAEVKFGRLFIDFAVLAIFISCLGLLGLASYSTVQRTKEVGVRRVLGASVTGIVRLLSFEFLQLVGLAFLVAAPVGWYVMHRWQDNFAYKAGLAWWIFAGAGLIAMLIAFGTISYQAIRAAMVSPVKSLHSE